MNAMPIRPSRTYYLLATGMLLAALAADAAGVIFMIRHMGLPSDQIVVPGSGQFGVDEPGEYMVFYESQATIDGRTYSGPSASPAMTCHIRSLPGGEETPLSPMSGSYTYRSPNREGTAVWTFEARQAGRYELSATYDAEQTVPDHVVLAVGRGFPWKAMLVVGGAFLTGALLGLSAIAVFVVTLIKRVRAKGSQVQ